MRETSPQVFFFKARAEGISPYYGGHFDPAFLKAIAAVDSTHTVDSPVLRGDVLVETLCTVVTGVTSSDNGRSSTYRYDMETYRTVVWDLADAFAQQWNTVDLESFPIVLAHGRIHCVMLPSLQIGIREGVDQQLRKTNGYLGSLEVDLGNPLQFTLFLRYLVYDAFIAGGAVYLERGWDGVDDTVFEGASDFSPRGEQRLAPDKFRENKPPLPIFSGLSDRGRLSAERYEGKRVYTIQERVIDGISRLPALEQADVVFTSSSAPDTIIEAELPEAKFVQYLLNPEHKDGAGKAKFFREVLVIGPADWRYLAAQFYEGLRRSDVSELKIKTWQDGFGASFNCVLPITGLNGRVVQVFTNWIMRPGQLPQLTTARPEDETDVVNEVGTSQPSIVSSQLPEKERWEELYRLAHAAGTSAAEACVPTPMKVSGFPVEMEGMCGSASIRIPDARRGFARWLVQSGTGDRHYSSGARVFAYHPAQSIDRAVAYAKAFAAVLQLNGVECNVESRLD